MKLGKNQRIMLDDVVKVFDEWGEGIEWDFNLDSLCEQVPECMLTFVPPYLSGRSAWNLAQRLEELGLVRIRRNPHFDIIPTAKGREAL